jgi:hypothetical protein
LGDFAFEKKTHFSFICQKEGAVMDREIGKSTLRTRRTFVFTKNQILSFRRDFILVKYKQIKLSPAADIP